MNKEVIKSKKGKLPKPDFNLITFDWIEEQKELHRVSDYEFSLQVSKSRGYWQDIKSGRIGRITGGVQSAAWHFFKRLESGKKV